MFIKFYLTVDRTFKFDYIQIHNIAQRHKIYTFIRFFKSLLCKMLLRYAYKN